MIILDVPRRTGKVDRPDDELNAREASATAAAAYASAPRGWQKIYIEHVLQADRGADLDFLVGASGHVISRESH